MNLYMTDEVLRKTVKLLANSAYWAYKNTLWSKPEQSAAEYFERVSHPVIGDMVLEITNWNADILDRIGLLVSAEQEPPPHMDEASYHPEDWNDRPWPPYLEKVWRIITLDGRDFYWTNAHFIAIPGSPWKVNPNKEDHESYKVAGGG